MHRDGTISHTDVSGTKIIVSDRRHDVVIRISPKRGNPVSFSIGLDEIDGITGIRDELNHAARGNTDRDAVVWFTTNAGYKLYLDGDHDQISVTVYDTDGNYAVFQPHSSVQAQSIADDLHRTYLWRNETGEEDPHDGF